MPTSHPALQPHSWIGCWSQFSRHLQRALRERYAGVGLPETTVFVLEALSTATAHLTQSDLARELNISESSLCGLIERMRQEGLLQRERSWKDRRKSVLTLTSLGEDLYRKISQIHDELGDQFLGGFTPEQREQFSRLILLLLHPQPEMSGSAESSLRRIAS